jgi:suppressor of ftsI
MLELIYFRRYVWGILFVLVTLALWQALAYDKRTTSVPEEPQVRGSNHRVKITLLARTTADGHSQFRSEAGTEPPVLRVWPGDKLDITYVNELAAKSNEACAMGPCMNMTNLHFHGLAVSPQPGQDDVLGMIAHPGESLHYSLDIPVDQTPGLFWYHTHPHGESMRQDLDGMSGAIVVEGIDRYVPQVRGLRERVLVLRERAVNPQDKTGVAKLERLLGISSATRGSSERELERVFTVNNALRPRIEIAPHERQFWRIVNAAPDRYADLRLSGKPFEIVAMDGMPLAYRSPNRPILKVDHVLLPPGGRVEAIVEGPPQNANTKLRTDCVDTGSDGDWNPDMVLADIVPQSSTDGKSHSIVPDYGAAVAKPVDLKRFEKTGPDFVVTFTEDKHGFYINGEKYELAAGPMTKVHVGTYQHWRIVNNTHEIHPMHIHQVHFLAYATNGARMENPLWLDTVNVPVGGSVDVIMDFTDPVIKGMSVFHCHLLNHEDKGMMAKILFQ